MRSFLYGVLTGVALFTLLLSAAACGRHDVTFVYGIDGKDGARGEQGIAGENALPCTVERQETGALISCPDMEPVFVADGERGEAGEPGETGPPGSDGQDANGITVTSIGGFSGSACVSLGSGKYGKRSGSDNIKIYSNSFCASPSVEELGPSGVELYWLTANSLLVYAPGPSLKLLNF